MSETKIPTPVQEAVALVGGDRAAEYGPAERSFDAIATVWTGLLASKLRPGVVVTGTDVAILMSGMKLSREANGTGKRDNWVDLLGYGVLGARIAGHGG